MRAPQYGHSKAKKRGGNPASKPMGDHMGIGPKGLAMGKRARDSLAGTTLGPVTAKQWAGHYNPPRDKRASRNDVRNYALPPARLSGATRLDIVAGPAPKPRPGI